MILGLVKRKKHLYELSPQARLVATDAPQALAHEMSEYGLDDEALEGLERFVEALAFNRRYGWAL